MPRIELGRDPNADVPFRFRVGDRVRARTTGKAGHIVGGRYHGPVPAAGVAVAYAISYTVHPERGADFLALGVELRLAA